MAETFAERWARKERECGLENITARFVKCGSEMLPDKAAPCLGFAEAAQQLPVCDVFDSSLQWSTAERERLAGYRMIGSDGAGNPICVEAHNGTVVLLDHEDRFRTRQFLNSSVELLAECLLVYLGESDPERFRAAVGRIDRAAIGEGTFWWHEAASLARNE